MSNSKIRPIKTVMGILLGMLAFWGFLSMVILLIVSIRKNLPEPGSSIVLAVLVLFTLATGVPSFRFLKPVALIIFDKMKPDLHGSGKYYAGFWMRLGAGLVDFAIFSPLYFCWYFVGKMNLVAFEFCYWAMFLDTVYTFLMVMYFGQTIGKMVFKVKVFKANGDNVTRLESLKRLYGDIGLWVLLVVNHIVELTGIDPGQVTGMTYQEILKILAKHSSFGMWLFLLMILWYFSEFVTLLFNKQKRAIHDFIGGTILLNQSGNRNRTT